MKVLNREVQPLQHVARVSFGFGPLGAGASASNQIGTRPGGIDCLDNNANYQATGAGVSCFDEPLL